MKHSLVLFGLLASFAFTESLPAHADVGPLRVQKEYAKMVYDFAVDGGAVGAHASLNSLPAGVIPTAIYVYINTRFTGSASVGFGCVGTNDLFAYHDLTAVGADFYYAGVVSATAFQNGVSVLNFGAPALHADNGKSVPSDCVMTTNIANAAVTGGKFTAIVEYFKLP